MLDANTFAKRPLNINKQHEKIVFILMPDFTQPSGQQRRRPPRDGAGGVQGDGAQRRFGHGPLLVDRVSQPSRQVS